MASTPDPYNDFLEDEGRIMPGCQPLAVALQRGVLMWARLITMMMGDNDDCVDD